jgi:hypothetical protein
MRAAVGALLAGAVLLGCGGSRTTKTIIIQTKTVTKSSSTSSASSTTETLTETVSSGVEPVYFFASPAFGLQPEQRPTQIVFSADGSRWMNAIKDWIGWGSRTAGAVGVWHAKTCVPSCAQSPTLSERAELTLDRIGVYKGRRIYLCYEVAFARTSRLHNFGFCFPPDSPARSYACRGGFNTDGTFVRATGFYRDVRERNAGCSVALSVAQKYVTAVAQVSGQQKPTVMVGPFRCVTASGGNVNNVTCLDPAGRLVTFFGAA